MAKNINISVRFNFVVVVVVVAHCPLCPFQLYPFSSNAANDGHKNSIFTWTIRSLKGTGTGIRTCKLFIKTDFNGNAILDYNIVANSCIRACMHTCYSGGSRLVRVYSSDRSNVRNPHIAYV